MLTWAQTRASAIFHSSFFVDPLWGLWAGFLMDFGLLLGSPEGHFGGNFGAMFANRSDYVDFFVIFFQSRKIE